MENSSGVQNTLYPEVHPIREMKVHLSDDQMTNTENYPFVMEYMPQRFLKKAEEELFETPEKRKTFVEEIRYLIRKNKTMNEDCLTDEEVIMYLRSRKYDLQKTFTALKRCKAFCMKYPQYLTEMDPAITEKAARQKFLNILPIRDKDGCAVVVLKTERWNPSEVNFTDAVKFAIMFILQALRDPMNQVSGFKVIYDSKCSALRYLRFCTPVNLQMVCQALFECAPGRFKAIHIIHPSIIFKVCWSLIFPFLPEKFKKRIFIHENPSKVLSYLSASLVPVEYGGKVNDYEFSTSWAKHLTFPEYLRQIGKPHVP